MPKRNIVILIASCLACLAAWVARERGDHGHRFGEVMAAIERSYIDDVDAERLFDAAVDAAMSRLDEHSAYLRGADRTGLESALDQQFGGVGLELSYDPIVRQPVVVSPVFDGPAWRAGIAAGDRIVAIDGIPTEGQPLRESVEQLRGPPEHPVTVAIVSPAESVATLDPGVTLPAERARSITLVRQIVEIESVQGDRRGDNGRWQWMLEGEPGVAYVRIESFGEQTAPEFTAAIDEITAEPATQALIIDLRGNPGGLLRSAVAVCDALLDDGVIVSMRGDRGEAAERGGLVDVRRATAGAALAEVPIAVLVDGLTASAAEIVAACLQDSGRAVVVGSRTFGKGTVQSIIPLSDGHGLLKLTTSEYLRPSRENIHRRREDDDNATWGVRPDAGCEVTPTAEAIERLREWRRAREIVPARGTSPAVVTESAMSPRAIDAVLARGLEAMAAR